MFVVWLLTFFPHRPEMPLQREQVKVSAEEIWSYTNQIFRFKAVAKAVVVVLCRQCSRFNRNPHDQQYHVSGKDFPPCICWLTESCFLWDSCVWYIASLLSVKLTQELSIKFTFSSLLTTFRDFRNRTWPGLLSLFKCSCSFNAFY